MTTQFVPCPNAGRCGSQTHQVGSAAFQECLAASMQSSQHSAGISGVGIATPPAPKVNEAVIESSGPGNITRIRGVNGFFDDEDEDVEGLDPEDVLDNITQSPYAYEVTQREDGSIWANAFNADDLDPSSSVVAETNYEVASNELTIRGSLPTTEDKGNRLAVPLVDDKGRVTPEAVRMNSLVNTLNKAEILDDFVYQEKLWQAEKETVENAILDRQDDDDTDYGLDLNDPEIVEEIAFYMSCNGFIYDGGTYVDEDELELSIKNIASRRNNI